MATILVASVLPDIDLLWFYFVDHRQSPHHTYWTHIPSFWLALGALAILAALILRRRSLLPYIFAVTLGALIHLVLDTVAGGIYWLYPLSVSELRWVDVPAAHGWWVANFILHWSFAFELALLVVAVWLHRSRMCRTTAPPKTTAVGRRHD